MVTSWVWSWVSSLIVPSLSAISALQGAGAAGSAAAWAIDRPVIVSTAALPSAGVLTDPLRRVALPAAGGAQGSRPPAELSRFTIDPLGRAAVEGTAPPATRVALAINGRLIEGVTSDPAGAWRIELNGPLTVGDHHIVLRLLSQDGSEAVIAAAVRLTLPASLPRPFAVELTQQRDDAPSPGLRERAERLGRDASRGFDELLPGLDGKGATPNGQQAAPRIAQDRGGGAPVGEPAPGSTPDSGDGAMQPVWDWLERAHRTYQSEVVRRLASGGAVAPAGQPSEKLKPAGTERDAGPKGGEPVALPGLPSLEEVRQRVSAWLDDAGRQYQRVVVDRLKGLTSAEPPPSSPAGPPSSVAKTDRLQLPPNGLSLPQSSPSFPQSAAPAPRGDKQAVPFDPERALQLAREQAEARRRAEAERQAALEAEAKRKAAAEAQERGRAEQEAKRIAEAEARQKANVERMEAERRRLVELERQRIAEEEARRRREAEDRRRAERGTDGAARKDPPRSTAQDQPRPQAGDDGAGRRRVAVDAPGQAGGGPDAGGGRPDPAARPPAPGTGEASQPEVTVEDRRRLRAVAAYQRRAERVCRSRAGRRIRLPGHYVVADGDSLWEIAQRFYGRGSLYTLIVRANEQRLDDEDMIRPCQRLYLPRPGRRS